MVLRPRTFQFGSGNSDTVVDVVVVVVILVMLGSRTYGHQPMDHFGLQLNEIHCSGPIGSCVQLLLLLLLLPLLLLLLSLYMRIAQNIAHTCKYINVCACVWVYLSCNVFIFYLFFFILFLHSFVVSA